MAKEASKHSTQAANRNVQSGATRARLRARCVSLLRDRHMPFKCYGSRFQGASPLCAGEARNEHEIQRYRDCEDDQYFGGLTYGMQRKPMS